MKEQSVYYILGTLILYYTKILHVTSKRDIFIPCIVQSWHREIQEAQPSCAYTKYSLTIHLMDSQLTHTPKALNDLPAPPHMPALPPPPLPHLPRSRRPCCCSLSSLNTLSPSPTSCCPVLKCPSLVIPRLAPPSYSCFGSEVGSLPCHPSVTWYHVTSFPCGEVTQVFV